MTFLAGGTGREPNLYWFPSETNNPENNPRYEEINLLSTCNHIAAAASNPKKAPASKVNKDI